MAERSAYQERVIRNYYKNQDAIQLQRLGEMVTNLYLAEEKQRSKLWKNAATAMQKLGVPESRIKHLLDKQDPALVAKVVEELMGRK